ncbi:acetate/propionate family kinase [Candidatus Latescibacterota bacterium]
MKVIVCNIGSTSFKFQLLDMVDEQVLSRGHIERVGSDKAHAQFFRGKDDLVVKEEKPVMNQRAAVQWGLDFLKAEIIDNLNEIDAVGFKAVQAGEENGSVLLTEKVITAMEECNDLAPAHNPAYVEAIRMFGELMPGKALVGVFEPGFHFQKPEYTQVYGVPYEWYSKYGVRRYGYHSASLRYVTFETVKRCNLDQKHHSIVACHLGGSSSVCAFKDGISIDTSMGFTPQSGVIQSSRIGDMDGFIVPYMMKKTGMSIEDVYKELGSNGGLKGISGISGDMRDILDAIGRGDRRAELARNKYIYDIKFYTGAFILLMGGIDAICFTGGTGQKDSELRREILSSLEFLGFKLDEQANKENRERIDSKDSKIAALVIETNEELIVARESVRVVEDQTQGNRDN